MNSTQVVAMRNLWNDLTTEATTMTWGQIKLSANLATLDHNAGIVMVNGRKFYRATTAFEYSNDDVWMGA